MDNAARRDGRVLLAATLSALALAACGGPSAEEERALVRLERLVFVPPGVCSIGLAGLDCSNPEALLVDRYEVTRGEWQAHLSRTLDTARGPGALVWDRWAEDSETLPATFMTQAEAMEFASQEGMRLLTQREWLRTSAGTRAQPWPWGTSPARSVANTLDLGLQGPLGVGTFEAGATPSGIYDLIGNAREWVTVESGGNEASGLAAAMGGSWLSHQAPLFDWDPTSGLSLAALEVDSRHRSVDLGFRLSESAVEYLVQAAPAWGTSPSTKARVIAVGRRWGRPAAELLRDLSGEGPLAINWLLEGAEQ
ncbi:MAG: formylglycine-generating enzyme family protein [Planctomycetes bacterium]|nr:formylglycine-generating enzyme family protein [Planctomycetota bacterium]